MENKRMFDELIELISINVRSGEETEMAAALEKKMTELGFTVTRDQAGETFGGVCGNLLCVREGELPGSLFLCAHMDRVPNGFDIKPVVRDGILYSDGTTILAADDVSGLCAILEGIRRVLEKKIPLPRLEVLFTVGEEKGLLGAQAMDRSLMQSEMGFIFDSPGHTGRFVNGAPGHCKLGADIIGLASHAGNTPEKGIDAAKIMCEIIATLETGRLDFETTSNFPILSTGSKVFNVVCDFASLDGEVRSQNKEKMQAYIEAFENHCREIARKRGAKVELRRKITFQPFRIPETDLTLQLAKEACERLGLEFLVEVGGGGMDANVFNTKGLTCVGVATGYSKNHSKEEQLILEDFYKSGELAEELIRGFAATCQ